MNDTTSNPSIVFKDYSFSIRCDKCADIHQAQLDGKSTKPCECKCHEEYRPYVPYCPPDPCCPQFPPYSPTWVYTNRGTWF